MSSTIVERVRSFGIGIASPIDLAAIGYSRREGDVDDALEAARTIIAEGKRLKSLGEVGSKQIEEAFGLDPFEILRSQALFELGRRQGRVGKGPVVSITGPKDVYNLLVDYRGEKREHFCVVLLDAKNNVLRTSVVHIGTLSSSPVGMREVFRDAVREGASAIIVAHNHPSGDPTPSPEDIEITKSLVKAGVILDIPVLDHVILGELSYSSLADLQLL
jgi:DNA repair protein RadC